MTICIDRVAIFPGEELALIGVLSLRWHGHVNARNLEIGIGRWWPILLHGEKPGRRHSLGDA